MWILNDLNIFLIEKRGRAVAITSTGMGIGTTISAPMGLLLINTIGWRSTWLVFGLIIWLVVIPGYAIFMRRRPEDVGLLPDGLDGSVKDKHDIEPTKNMDQELNWTVKQALRTPVLWLILLASSIYIFCTSAILFLRVPFWNEIGIPQGIIAFGIGIDPFTVIFAVLLFGFLAERFPIRFMALIGGSWRAMSMLPLILFGTHSYSVLLHNVIWGVGSGAFVIAQNLVIPTYFGRHSQGSIGGVILPLMIIAGASGAPIVGYLVDNGINISTIWKMGSILMHFSGLLFFFLLILIGTPSWLSYSPLAMFSSSVASSERPFALLPRLAPSLSSLLFILTLTDLNSLLVCWAESLSHMHFPWLRQMSL